MDDLIGEKIRAYWTDLKVIYGWIVPLASLNQVGLGQDSAIFSSFLVLNCPCFANLRHLNFLTDQNTLNDYSKMLGWTIFNI